MNCCCRRMYLVWFGIKHFDYFARKYLDWQVWTQQSDWQEEECRKILSTKTDHKPTLIASILVIHAICLSHSIRYMEELSLVTLRFFFTCHPPALLFSAAFLGEGEIRTIFLYISAKRNIYAIFFLASFFLSFKYTLIFFPTLLQLPPRIYRTLFLRISCVVEMFESIK